MPSLCKEGGDTSLNLFCKPHGENEKGKDKSEQVIILFKACPGGATGDSDVCSPVHVNVVKHQNLDDLLIYSSLSTCRLMLFFKINYQLNCLSISSS
jgi:hypothetical protein